MACARANECKDSKNVVSTLVELDHENRSVSFENVRSGYLPGEQVLLKYTIINKNYRVNTNDHISLFKCCAKAGPSLYNWPVSANPYGRMYTIKLGLPNPDRQQKVTDYQFVYFSHERNEVVGRSGSFKISDIIELDYELRGEFDVSNFVDRELFKMKLTNPLPVKLCDNICLSSVKQSSAPTQSQKAQCSVGIQSSLGAQSNVGLQSTVGKQFTNGAQSTVGIQCTSTSQSTSPIQSTAALQSALQAGKVPELSAELRNALNSQVSSESIQRVAQLIRQYEQVYNAAQAVQPAKRQVGTAGKPRQQAQIDSIVQQVAKNNHGRTNEVDVEDVDMEFLKKFVFPYISGVLEHLMTNGFSRIVCKNDQVVVLANRNGKTLDLRHELEAYASNKNHQMGQHEEVDINSLAEKCKQLGKDVEILKMTSNSSHVQCMKEIGELRNMLGEKCSQKVDEGSSSVDELQKYNKALLARIGMLQEKLDEKVEEYEMLSKLFVSQACCLQHNDSVELLRKHKPKWRRTKREGTNTHAIQTKDEAVGASYQTCNKKTATSDLASRPPVVQKATSYAAATSHDDASAEKKHVVASDRALGAGLTNDQQSFLKVIQKMVNTEQEDKQADDVPISDSESAGSLAAAMKRLFDIYSSPSLASTTTSWHSTKSDDSILEAVKALFGSDSSIHNLAKTNSYPATPCNSADNVTRSKQGEKVKQTASMREVLKRLLNAHEEQQSETKACESKSSLWSLGEAMIRAFREDLSCTDIQQKKNLSTSNESLSHAMHWLFDTLSQHDLDTRSGSDLSQPVDSDNSSSSLGSILLWGLTEPTPEEYKNVDVQAVNREKQKKGTEASGTFVDCECHKAMEINKEKKHPSLSSVIRTSSPDRNVNISFPVNNQNKPVTSPTPCCGQASRQSTNEPKLFTFTANTPESGNVNSSPDKQSRDENFSPVFTKRLGRPKKTAHKKTRYTCSHCGIVIQSRSIGQTEYRMNRHIRLHHKKDDEWYM